MREESVKVFAAYSSGDPGYSFCFYCCFSISFNRSVVLKSSVVVGETDNKKIVCNFVVLTRNGLHAD